jgi:hypothetical protein
VADCFEVRILDRLKTVLAGINGAGGGYNYDFSAQDAVKVGALALPDLPLPCVTFVPVPMSMEHGIALGRYKPTWRFAFAVVVATTDDTAEGRIRAAYNALADITKAVEADRTLGGLVYDLIFAEKDEVAASVIEDPRGFAIGEMTMECWRERPAGSP